MPSFEEQRPAKRPREEELSEEEAIRQSLEDHEADAAAGAEQAEGAPADASKPAETEATVQPAAASVEGVPTGVPETTEAPVATNETGSGAETRPEENKKKHPRRDPRLRTTVGDRLDASTLEALRAMAARREAATEAPAAGESVEALPASVEAAAVHAAPEAPGGAPKSETGGSGAGGDGRGRRGGRKSRQEKGTRRGKEHSRVGQVAARTEERSQPESELLELTSHVGDALFDTVHGDTTELVGYVPDPAAMEGGYFRVRNISKKGNPREYPLAPSMLRTMLTSKEYEVRRGAVQLESAPGATIEQPAEKTFDVGQFNSLEEGSTIVFERGPQVRVVKKEVRPTGLTLYTIEGSDGKEYEFTTYGLEQFHDKYPVKRIEPPAAPPPGGGRRPPNSRSEEPPASGARQHVEDAIENDKARRRAYHEMGEKDGVRTAEHGGRVESEAAAPVEADRVAEETEQPRPEAEEAETTDTIYTPEVLRNPNLDRPTPLRDLESDEETAEQPVGDDAVESEDVEPEPVPEAHEPEAHEQKVSPEEMLERLKHAQKFDVMTYDDGSKGYVGFMHQPDQPDGYLWVTIKETNGDTHGGYLNADEFEAAARHIVSFETKTPEEFEKELSEEKPLEHGAEGERFSEAWLEHEFQKFNISSEELHTIERYNELSQGQRALLLENFKQSVAGRIEAEAGDAYRAETAEAGTLGKVWRGLAKNFYIAGEKRKSLEELQGGGVRAHGDVLTALVKGLREHGPEAHIEKGELKLDIIREEDFGVELSAEQKETLGEFNWAAHELSKMPHEWSLKSATRKQQREYQRAKEVYDAARDNLLAVGLEQGRELETAKLMTEREQYVKLNQFLNEHSDVERQLQKIGSPKLWAEALKTTIAERALYFTGGTLSRMAVVSMFGILAAPAAAAGFGWFTARKRAQKELRERDRLARRGVEDEAPEAANVVRAKDKDLRMVRTEGEEETQADVVFYKSRGGLVQKIDYLIERFESESNPRKQAELAKSLVARLEYSQRKLSEGKVNFGDASADRVQNAYALSAAMARGMAALQEAGSGGEKEAVLVPTVKSALQERLDSYLSFRGEKIDAKRKEYMRTQSIRGAKIAFQFALAGRLVSEVYQYMHGSGAVAAEAAQEPAVPRKGLEQAATEHRAAPRAPAAEQVRTSREAAGIMEERFKAEHPGVSERPEDFADELESSSRLTVEPETPPHAAAPVSEATPEKTGPTAVAETGHPEPAAQAHALPRTEAIGEAARHAHKEVSSVIAESASEKAGGAATEQLTVEVHQGEGMIRALGRSLEEKYGIPHERAMALANRVWAESDADWYEKVHAGDRFTVDVEGLTADKLRSGGLADVSKHLSYEAESFKPESGMSPAAAHEVAVPVGERAVAAASETAQTGLTRGFTAEQAYAHYMNLENHPVTLYPSSAKFLAEHHIYYDPAKKEFWQDLNADGVHDVSEKAHGLAFDHPEQVHQMRFTMRDASGENLVVEMYDAEGKIVGTFDMNSQLEVTDAASREDLTTYAENILFEKGRAATKLLRDLKDFNTMQEVLKKENVAAAHVLNDLNAGDVAAAGKRDIMRTLIDECKLPKPQARDMAKVLHKIFERIEDHANPKFGENETLAHALKRIRFE